MNYIEKYVQWFGSQMSEHYLSEITFPFLDRHMDCIMLYMEKQKENEYRISDDGYILNDLSMCGVSVNKKNNDMYLKVCLNRHGIRLDRETNELYVISTEENIPLSWAGGKTHGFNRGMKARFLLFFSYFCYIIYIQQEKR